MTNVPRALVLSSVVCMVACDPSNRVGAEAFSRADSVGTVRLVAHLVPLS